MRWAAMAASIVVALGIGWLGGVLSLQGGREADELVAGYLRVALGAHAVDVASSDRHTVKPWFAGRVDYSPPVHDLTAVGFPLVGGRLDVVDGRKVAVLVYRRNQHWLALTLWPAVVVGRHAAYDHPARRLRAGRMAAWRLRDARGGRPDAGRHEVFHAGDRPGGRSRALTAQASRSSSLTMASPISWVPTFLTPSLLPPASRSAVR